MIELYNMFDIVRSIRFIKKNLSRQDILIIFLLLFAFFATRLTNLESFPIFSDEGIYIRWAKVAWHDASWRFISLTDGRQPLQTWATIPFLKLFPDRALFAGRLFGVASGFVAMIGIFSLSSYLFGKKTAYIASLLYIITPFYLFFDRLAMVDSLVNASFVWILFLSLLLINTLRYDVALFFGFIAGMFMLAKSSVSLFLGLSIFAPLTIFSKSVQKNSRTIINYVFLMLIVIIIVVLFYNIQRLSPFLHFVSEKNNTFVKTWDEFVSEPFSAFWYNLRYTPLHTAYNAGWATTILGILGFVFFYRKNKRMSLYFLLWIFIPYVLTTFFMKVLFSRYVIFLIAPFIIFAAYFLATKVKKTLIWIVVLILLYSFTVYFDYTIMFDYKSIPFLCDDRGQYIEGYPSGYGAREIIEYARLKAQEKPVIILAEGNFGMSGDVLDVFLKRGDRIEIKGFWPLEKKHVIEAQKEKKMRHVFAVFAKSVDNVNEWPLELIQKYEKPGGAEAIYFFKVL